MKKTFYCKPEIEVKTLKLVDFLMTSGVTGKTDDGDGMEYGGVDDDGTIEPGAKGFWDDEEDY